MDSPHVPSTIPIDEELGAALIGIILSTVIYGVTCLQVFLYFTQHCDRDGRVIKGVVAAVTMLDTLHVALVVTFYYDYAVTHFGEYLFLEEVNWSLSLQILVASIISLIVKFFFASRVHRLSGKRVYFPVIICILAIAQIILTIAYVIVDFVYPKYTDDIGGYKVLSPAAFVADIVCDLFITVCMINYLRKERTMFEQTNRAINLLIKYSLNSCLLTSIFGILCAITYLVASETLLETPFFFILARLYPCSLLSTLNSRGAIRQALNEDDIELANISHPSDGLTSSDIVTASESMPVLNIARRVAYPAHRSGASSSVILEHKTSAI